MKFEALEDRLVPSGTPLDLTVPGSEGSVNGALFRQYSPQPTGTGYINSFVRLQTTGAKATVEQGYNTDARPVQFDENTSPNFTRSLHLGDVPAVDIGGVVYREFLLDVNQKASQPLLSLDELRFYVGAAGDLHNYDPTSHTLSWLSSVFDLDAGGDNWIKLDSRNSHGSGSGDMLAYIPDSVFGASASNPNPNIYLYSKFGVNLAGNSGFEEWAAGKSPLTAATGGISGSVFCTTMNAGEPDVTVFLDANHNGVLDANEVYTTTDANGNYSFSALATGLGAYTTYDVRILPPPGATAQTLDQTVSLQTAGQMVTGVNFWITCPVDTTGTGTGSGSGGVIIST